MKTKPANKAKFCWYGRDEDLKKCIEKSKFVKNVREKLARKKYQHYFKKQD